MLQPRPIAVALLILVAVSFRLIPYALNALGVPIDLENTL